MIIYYYYYYYYYYSIPVWLYVYCTALCVNHELSNCALEIKEQAIKQLISWDLLQYIFYITCHVDHSIQTQYDNKIQNQSTSWPVSAIPTIKSREKGNFMRDSGTQTSSHSLAVSLRSSNENKQMPDVFLNCQWWADFAKLLHWQYYDGA